MWFKKRKYAGGIADITVTNGKEEAPEFAKRYSAQLTDQVHVEVFFRTSSYLGRYPSGMCYQKNGNYISFSPDSIADKILDPALVPIIEDFVRAAKEIDGAFVKSKPKGFVDKTGTKWIRA